VAVLIRPRLAGFEVTGDNLVNLVKTSSTSTTSHFDEIANDKFSMTNFQWIFLPSDSPAIHSDEDLFPFRVSSVPRLTSSP
jgi:hypothetical protein